jgi:hypothetical protein
VRGEDEVGGEVEEEEGDSDDGDGDDCVCLRETKCRVT